MIPACIPLLWGVRAGGRTPPPGGCGSIQKGGKKLSLKISQPLALLKVDVIIEGKEGTMVAFNNVEIVTTCPCCGSQETILVNPVDFSRWKAGTYAQDAFPYLTASQRERLISGICDPCFIDLFSEDEDDDD